MFRCSVFFCPVSWGLPLVRHTVLVRKAHPRTPLFSADKMLRKRPPATPARLAVGAVLFAACALGAWLTIPRPDLRVINASGQAIAITVSSGQATASQKLGVDRVWAVEPDFPAGQPLRVQVSLPGGVAVDTSIEAAAFPLRVAVAEDGTVAPR